jgi:UDP-glucose:glycoprotein glucosyltransferase
MEVPPAWVVVSKESIYDLDNIVLSKLPPSAREQGINAVYSLKNILIDGHARDVSQGSHPPRGLQIILGTEEQPHVVDTIAMANLGYLQLKANPGVWTLSLKEGRSREIFELESVGSEGWLSRGVAKIGREVYLTSFEGITIYPRVVRREGMEKEDVLEEEKLGFVNQAEKFVSGWKEKLTGSTSAVTKKQADINIFSVASGHLYERFIYIMIQSVLQHTNSSVKFWFIENFLSPSFKVFSLGFLLIRNSFRCWPRSLDLTTNW